MPDDHRRPVLLAVLGLVLALVGIVGYFLVVFELGGRLPGVRNEAIPNWLLVALGLVLSTLAVVRAGRRLVPGVLLGANVALAALFFVFLYVFAAVPAVAGPRVGAAAPAFTLVDEKGATVRLEDFRGAPLLLVFYRGHW